MLFHIPLKKSGPIYIGPRGGKWADPKHTIPYKEEEQKTDQRYSDSIAEEILDKIGNALYEHQLTSIGPYGKPIKDDTGLNHYDLGQWRLANTLKDKRRILQKYKRQIKNSYGEDEYHKLGLSDKENMKSSVAPYYHKNFGSLQLPVDGYLGKDNFSNYVAIQKKYGASFDGQTKTWYIKPEKLSSFDFDSYRSEMADIGIKVKDIRGERPKAKTKEELDSEFQYLNIDKAVFAITSKKVTNGIALKKVGKNTFAFYYSFSKPLNELFKNREYDPKRDEKPIHGVRLSGVVKVNAEKNFRRETSSADLVEEAIEKIKRIEPSFNINIDPEFKEAQAARDRYKAELELPIPEVQSMLVSGAKLRPYQNEGVRFLKETDGNALIGDEMGLGKTIQTLAWVATAGKKAIIVNPKTTRRGWIKEAAKFFPDYFKGMELDSGELRKLGIDEYKKLLKDKNIVSVNYESLEKFEPILKEMGFDTIVVDESHRMKNPKAKVTKTIQRVAKPLKHKILLSGTAIKNKKDELFTQLDLIKPGKYHNARELKFATIGGLWEDMKDVYLARAKDKVLKDLPPKTTSISGHDIKGLPDYHINSDGSKALIDANGEVIKDKVEIGDIAWLKNNIALGKADATVDMAKEILDSSDSKILIFTDSVEVAKKIAKELGDTALLHHGQMDNDKREAIKEEFQRQNEYGEFVSSKRVLVSTRQSLAVGATLTAADKVIFNDIPWTAADIRQAEDRTHRIGQKNAVNIYWTTADNNIFDSSVAEIVKRKYALGVKVNQGRKLTDEEIKWMNEKVTLEDIIKNLTGKKTEGDNFDTMPEVLSEDNFDTMPETPVERPKVEPEKRDFVIKNLGFDTKRKVDKIKEAIDLGGLGLDSAFLIKKLNNTDSTLQKYIKKYEDPNYDKLKAEQYYTEALRDRVRNILTSYREDWNKSQKILNESSRLLYEAGVTQKEWEDNVRDNKTVKEVRGKVDVLRSQAFNLDSTTTLIEVGKAEIVAAEAGLKRVKEYIEQKKKEYPKQLSPEFVPEVMLDQKKQWDKVEEDHQLDYDQHLNFALSFIDTEAKKREATSLINRLKQSMAFVKNPITIHNARQRYINARDRYSKLGVSEQVVRDAYDNYRKILNNAYKDSIPKLYEYMNALPYIVKTPKEVIGINDIGKGLEFKETKKDGKIVYKAEAAYTYSSLNAKINPNVAKFEITATPVYAEKEDTKLKEVVDYTVFVDLVIDTGDLYYKDKNVIFDYFEGFENLDEVKNHIEEYLSEDSDLASLQHKSFDEDRTEEDTVSVPGYNEDGIKIHRFNNKGIKGKELRKEATAIGQLSLFENEPQLVLPVSKISKPELPVIKESSPQDKQKIVIEEKSKLVVPKKRGRPPKPKMVITEPIVPKKRGRPPKPKPEVPISVVPKKRGRPPKEVLTIKQEEKVSSNKSLYDTSIEAFNTHRAMFTNKYKQEIYGQKERLERTYGKEALNTGDTYEYIRKNDVRRGVEQTLVFDDFHLYNQQIKPLLDENDNFIKDKLDKKADNYADRIINAWAEKVANKFENVDSLEAPHFDGENFKLKAKREGRIIELNQKIIWKTSKLGKDHAQFPTRFKVDGKSYSESEYKDEFQKEASSKKSSELKVDRIKRLQKDIEAIKKESATLGLNRGEVIALQEEAHKDPTILDLEAKHLADKNKPANSEESLQNQLNYYRGLLDKVRSIIAKNKEKVAGKETPIPEKKKRGRPRIVREPIIQEKKKRGRPPIKRTPIITETKQPTIERVEKDLSTVSAKPIKLNKVGSDKTHNIYSVSHELDDDDAKIVTRNLREAGYNVIVVPGKDSVVKIRKGERFYINLEKSLYKERDILLLGA